MKYFNLKTIINCFYGVLTLFFIWFCFFAFAPAYATTWVLFWGEDYKKLQHDYAIIDECYLKHDDDRKAHECVEAARSNDWGRAPAGG